MVLLVAIFVLGYVAIVFEHPLQLNKSASALAAGVLCWTIYAVQGDTHLVNEQLGHHLAQVSAIVFFLLGAMTIVELIDAHDGFDLITSRIRTVSRRRLLVTIAALSFVLSAVLDNLTASIVMISLVRKLVPGETDRKYYAGIVILAANSGGVWSPIGDVTTTMLWVGGQVTTTSLVVQLVLPAIVSILIPLVWIGWRLEGNLDTVATPDRTRAARTSTAWERKFVLFAGIAVLVSVPVFKTLTHLPPYLGMLLGLAVLWGATEMIHKRKPVDGKGPLSVVHALQRADTPSVLFFLGILLAISALESTGLLASLAQFLDHRIGNADVVTIMIGLSSSIVDNVPLVAASQGMYSLATFPQDHQFWLFLAYCAGTGGSILIIGSAAGIAVMGIQRITFGWYVRHISLPALLGYAGGALTYLALAALRS